MQYRAQRAQRLKAARTRKGLTQKELAEALGRSTSTIKSWESENKPGEPSSLEDVIRLCKTLCVSVDWYIGTDEDQSLSGMPLKIGREAEGLPDDMAKQILELIRAIKRMAL